MIPKINIAIVLVLAFSGTLLSQNNSSRIGDDYARAALRALIYTKQAGMGGIDAERITMFLNEADVEASTAAEEASLKELNRILGMWISHPSVDNQACYLALKSNLKARNGATPEACK